jgi:hypothetical protein
LDPSPLEVQGYELGVGGICVREDKNKDSTKIIVYQVNTGGLTTVMTSFQWVGAMSGRRVP